MKRGITIFTGCLIILLIALCSFNNKAQADSALRVDQTKIKLILEDNISKLILPIVSSSNKPVDVDVHIEILGSKDQTLFSTDKHDQIKKINSKLVIPLNFSFAEIPDISLSEMIWSRLRYTIKYNVANSATDSISSIIALSQISDELFALDIMPGYYGKPGQPYIVRAVTYQPATKKPVAGISLTAELIYEDQEHTKLIATDVSDAQGFAEFKFMLPANTYSSADIKVTAHQGIFAQQTTGSYSLINNSLIIISTDKSLYQPAQTMHIRAIVFNQGMKAIANEPTEIVVNDPDGALLYRKELNTSQFGIVNTDWTIPANGRLGEYTVDVRLIDERYDNYYVRSIVKVSRYELPNFTVNVKPDRSYYLAGENATIDVSAKYLFGKPVKKGQVRIIKKADKHWDEGSNKFNIDNEDVFEGEVNSEGHFIAQIDLTEDHEDLKDRYYSNYQDIECVAIFTDASTNRTEQRRFDLRISRERIHVYATDNYRFSVGLPMQFYVSAYYADGTPAQCKVDISRVLGKDYSEKLSKDDYQHPFITVETNSYGLAKVVAPPLTNKEDFKLALLARDKDGNIGHDNDYTYVRDEPALHIEPKKRILHQGEAIEADIIANRSNLICSLELLNETGLLSSQRVQLKNGRAHIKFPYQENYQGVYFIAGYIINFTVGENTLDTSNYDTTSVIYPYDDEIKLDVKLNESSYRPGDNAQANIDINDGQGKGVTSALGAVIIDKAVEERMSTDRNSDRYLSGFINKFFQQLLSGANVSGVSYKDLKKLDMTKPVSPELDLIAKFVLPDNFYIPRVSEQQSYAAQANTVYYFSLLKQFAPVNNALLTEFEKSNLYPTNEQQLYQFLQNNSIDLNSIKDPWGMNYHFQFEPSNSLFNIKFISSGPDKVFNSFDDFTANTVSISYFQNYGKLIDKVAKQYHEKTSQYIRDAATFKTELKKEGVDFDSLRDPWGKPYTLKFDINRNNYTINISLDPFGPSLLRLYDLWVTSIDYFKETREEISQALVTYHKSTAKFPNTDIMLKTALKEANIDLDNIKDPWGHRYYATFNVENRYSNKNNIKFKFNSAGTPTTDYDIEPVTEALITLTLNSAGPDSSINTKDDFIAFNMSQVIKLQSGRSDTPEQISSSPLVSSNTSAIIGLITDVTGAVIAGAEVTLFDELGKTIITTTNEKGEFTFSNVFPGNYKLLIQAPGFNNAQVDGIVVKIRDITKINLELAAGNSNDIVEVSSAEKSVNTPQSNKSQADRSLLLNINQFTTPRVRQYFPETLYWQPELITDDNGHAEMQFKLADNITTWKMAVIASTIDGRIGITEQEFQAFQPFFIEHDPPQILTKGDEISLPVILRNYLTDDQKMRVEMKPNSWSTLIDGPVKESNVIANDATKAIFTFNATRSIKDGKQEVMATSLSSNNRDANDAISKPVSVHPDGVEVDRSSCQLINDRAKLEINIAEDASAEMRYSAIKIYPNLIAHGFESIEGILQRPYGCAEQTISSSYPSLLILKFNKQANIEQTNLRAKAERYLQEGYEKLIGYRNGDGGFSYWGRGTSDIALTAYALRFLNDVKDFITVDEDILDKANDFLVAKQKKDGNWPAYSYWNEEKDSQDSILLTAMVANMLAQREIDSTKNSSSDNGSLNDDKNILSQQKQQEKEHKALMLSLQYLEKQLNNTSDPYALASYALALFKLNESAKAARILNILRSVAHNEEHGIYWNLEINTPFYSWGLSGRLEASALVIKALTLDAQLNHRNPLADELINKGLLFLLHYKDRYGVWYSTQTTVNVVDALLTASLDASVNNETINNNSNDDKLTIMVNGSIYKEISLPDKKQSIAPITLELGELIKNGNNRVELIMNNSKEVVSAQLMASYYQPWNNAINGVIKEHDKSSNSTLKLAVQYDKTNLKIAEEVTVNVDAERVGFEGYGMMLAEIGLPPGADVDRASLDSAMERSGYAICYYDVLPDKVILYLWPRAGGIKFQFKFKPRYGINAKTAQSQIYDYYNSKEKVIIAPTKFSVY